MIRITANGITTEDETTIREILARHFPNDSSVVVSNGGAVDKSTNSACEIACNTAQSLAEQACMLITNPLGKTVCLAAAAAAGAACRSKC